MSITRRGFFLSAAALTLTGGAGGAIGWALRGDVEEQHLNRDVFEDPMVFLYSPYTPWEGSIELAFNGKPIGLLNSFGGNPFELKKLTFFNQDKPFFVVARQIHKHMSEAEIKGRTLDNVTITIIDDQTHIGITYEVDEKHSILELQQTISRIIGDHLANYLEQNREVVMQKMAETNGDLRAKRLYLDQERYRYPDFGLSSL